MTDLREPAAALTAAGGPPGKSVLAVDIGGTKLAALVDPDGGLRRRVTRRTPAGDGEAVWAALASVIADAAALCDLDRVVIGGGVGRAWDMLEPPLSGALRAYAGLAFVRRAEILPSELGGEAGLLGAAALVRDPELV